MSLQLGGLAVLSMPKDRPDLAEKLAVRLAEGAEKAKRWGVL